MADSPSVSFWSPPGTTFLWPRGVAGLLGRLIIFRMDDSAWEPPAIAVLIFAFRQSRFRATAASQQPPAMPMLAIYVPGLNRSGSRASRE